MGGMIGSSRSAEKPSREAVVTDGGRCKISFARVGSTAGFEGFLLAEQRSIGRAGYDRVGIGGSDKEAPQSPCSPSARRVAQAGRKSR